MKGAGFSLEDILIQAREISRLQAENAALKEVLAALVTDFVDYDERFDVERCHYCQNYRYRSDSDENRPHAPDCPVARAQGLLR